MEGERQEDGGTNVRRVGTDGCYSRDGESEETKENEEGMERGS